ncbi:MAG: type I restriction enzyme HsdR N-terminal domain-containing protein [Marinirhabdus sp.]
MKQLDFPKYTFRFRDKGGKIFIFDFIRKKFVRLTPEEWVRQHLLKYLVKDKNYPALHINVEKKITLHQTTKRYDAVVYHRNGGIRLIAECKAPQVPITQAAFDQIARYNLATKAELLLLTNGLQHYVCRLDHENGRYRFLGSLPHGGAQ